MLRDGKIWLANNEAGEAVYLLPDMANRHGLIAGATGTGKTVTAQGMAEAFSDMGVPVFLADVKGDLAGLLAAGADSENMQERIRRFGLAEHGFSLQGYPVNLWDIYGKKGMPLRTTISEMGPLLMARILQLNDLQSDILSIVYRIADDKGLLLVDIKDLKSMLNYVQDHAKEFADQYGRMSSASIGAILRALVALEGEGGEQFFGETALNIADWMQIGAGGRGMINILDSESLINNGRLYSTFMLWLLAELFEKLPEVGDPEKPKLVFFFDEAHLLFKDAPKALTDRVEQVVKLIRSKGVGVFFITQQPSDIPNAVLSQLGNRVQHALRAYTPAEQKAIRAAAQSFRVNPNFDTETAITELGTGRALVSFLDEEGRPCIVEKATILPPQSMMGVIDDERRKAEIQADDLYGKYEDYVDNESAYEIIHAAKEKAEKDAEAQRQAEEAEKQRLAEEKEAEKQRIAEEKEQARLEKERQKEEREKQKAAEQKKKAAQRVASKVGKTVTKELTRGLLGTLKKWF